MTGHSIGNSTALLDSIGERIRSIRKQRGLTQSELAGGDVTRNMLSRIENGAALPSLPTLCGIADRLGVPVAALLGDLGEYRLQSLLTELSALLKSERFDRMISVYESSDVGVPSDDIAATMCEAYIGSARERYMRGQLQGAKAHAVKASELLANVCEPRRSVLSDRIFMLDTLIAFCPALYPDDSPITDKGCSPKLAQIILESNAEAVYLYCLTRLNGLTHSAYSMPIEQSPALRAEITPLISGLSDGLFRRHIEAKLDLINADYLSAKAKLVTTLTPDPPPAILYDIYRDLEFCCKCCGDFENAYKYSGLRLELSKRLK